LRRGSFLRSRKNILLLPFTLPLPWLKRVSIYLRERNLVLPPFPPPLPSGAPFSSFRASRSGSFLIIGVRVAAADRALLGLSSPFLFFPLQAAGETTFRDADSELFFQQPGDRLFSHLTSCDFSFPSARFLLQTVFLQGVGGLSSPFSSLSSLPAARSLPT